MLIRNVIARCPKCKEKKLIKKGYYYTKAKPRKHRRYYCMSCERGVSFTRRKVRGWSPAIYKEILILINRQRFPITKYDPPNKN